MQLGNGFELIPKRDKVTYATNILGKWEDYSIDTYQGKVLKEAAERYKALLKAGKQDEVSADVPSLKSLLMSGKIEAPVAPAEEDFWSLPVQEEVIMDVPAPFVPEMDIVEEEKDMFEPIPLINTCTFVEPEDDDGRRYVIKAYIDKRTSRQIYLSGWMDSDDWSLSVVPFAASKARCEWLIERATKMIAEAEANNKSFMRKFPAYINFELEEHIPYKQPSHEELVAKAEAMKAANREKKGNA